MDTSPPDPERKKRKRESPLSDEKAGGVAHEKIKPEVCITAEQARNLVDESESMAFASIISQVNQAIYARACEGESKLEDLTLYVDKDTRLFEKVGADLISRGFCLIATEDDTIVSWASTVSDNIQS